MLNVFVMNFVVVEGEFFNLLFFVGYDIIWLGLWFFIIFVVVWKVVFFCLMKMFDECLVVIEGNIVKVDEVQKQVEVVFEEYMCQFVEVCIEVGEICEVVCEDGKKIVVEVKEIVVVEVVCLIVIVYMQIEVECQMVFVFLCSEVGLFVFDFVGGVVGEMFFDDVCVVVVVDCFFVDFEVFDF